MLDIITFFNNIKIVHRDIRPHNIIVIGNKIKVVDFEHCSINNQRVDDSPEELNENRRIGSELNETKLQI